MLKKKLLLFSVLSVLSFGLPALAAENQDKEMEKKVQQLFSNVPTPTYFKYIDKNGLSLDYLVKNAVASNKSFLASQQEIQAGQGRLQQAGLFLNPEIEADFGTNQIIDREGEYDFGLSYTQPIELFGRRGSRYRVAELQLEALRNEVQFEYVQLISEVKEEYVNVLVEAENLRITEQLLNLNKDLLEITQGQYRLGDVSKFDANLARIEVNRLRTQLTTAESRVKSALIRLKAAAGLDVNQDIKISGNFYSTGLIPAATKVENLQEMAVQNRFDLRAAALNQEVSQATVTQLQAENTPVINLTGGYQRERSIFDDTPEGVGVLEDTDNILRIGISMELPVFSRNQGNIAEAEATQKQNQFRREFLEQQIRRDVSVAYTNLQAARNNITTYDSLILKDARENLWITRGIHQLGEQDLIFVIIEQTRLIDIQKEYIDALREYNLSVVELERAVSLPVDSIIGREKTK